MVQGSAGEGEQDTLGVMPGPSTVEGLGLAVIGSEPQTGKEVGVWRTTTVGGWKVEAQSRIAVVRRR